MILDFEHDNCPPGRIFDAVGREVFDICLVETESGWATQRTKDDKYRKIYVRLAAPVGFYPKDKQSFDKWLKSRGLE